MGCGSPEVSQPPSSSLQSDSDLGIRPSLRQQIKLLGENSLKEI